MQFKEIAKRSAMPVTKSAVVGFAANGFLTFAMNLGNKIAKVPSLYIEENPNITVEEFLKKFSEFNKVLSNANLFATFGIFGIAVFTYLLTYLLNNCIKTGQCLPTESNPLIVDATTHVQINDSDVAPLPSQSSWKDHPKTAGLALVLGAAVWGFVSLIRSSVDRNLASYLADEAPSLEQVNSEWSFVIISNIIFAGALMAMGLAGGLGVIAVRTYPSFWRHSDNTNLNEESRLVAALPSKEADQPTVAQTLLNS